MSELLLKYMSHILGSYVAGGISPTWREEILIIKSNKIIKYTHIY